MRSSIPYAPFSKNDKLGRIVDWNQADAAAAAAGPGGASRRLAAGQTGKYGREPREAYGAGSANAFGYFHDEDEASFSVVDGAKSGAAKRGGSAGGAPALGRSAQYTRGGRGGGRGAAASGPGGRGGAYGGRGGRYDGAGRGGGGARGFGRGGRFGWKDWGREQRTRDASVTIGADWAVLEEVEFSRLGKLRLDVDTREVDTLCVFFLPRSPPSLLTR